MISLRSIAGKLLLLPLAIENFILLVAGLAGAITWPFAELVDVRSSDPWEILLIFLLTFSRRVTLTFLIFGGIAWILRWRKSCILSPRLDVKAENSRPWVLLVIIILMVHGYLAILFSHHLLPLFQENFGLLQGWGVWDGLRRSGEFSGIFLVPVLGLFLPTVLASMTAIAFIAGVLAFLGYLLLGREEYSRLLLRSICVQIACLLSLFFTLSFLESGIHVVTEHFVPLDAVEFKAQVLDWLTKQEDVLTSIAKHLTFLLPGFLVCEAVVLWKTNEKKSTDTETPIRLQEEIPLAEPTQIDTGSIVETNDRLKHKEYLIKYRFFSNPLYKVFDVYDSENKLAFTARMNSLSLRARIIRVYSVGKEGNATLVIRGRRLILFPNIFDVTYCPTNKKVGIFENSPAGWTILDEYGRNIGALKLEKASWRSLQGQIMIGHLSACKYIFQNLIRPIILISFTDDSAIIFDRKLGLGLALVLGCQSVAFNYPYSDVSAYAN